MKVIRVCDTCGAEQFSWMGGSHFEARSPRECRIESLERHYSIYYQTYRLAEMAHRDG